jgi:hypothetical protein
MYFLNKKLLKFSNDKKYLNIYIIIILIENEKELRKVFPPPSH